jgi:starch-binding outer membrane protein, SusD/RagB family
MKTSITYLYMIALLGITSCTDDFLDRKPKGNLTVDTFFENQDHAIQSVNAIYAQFRSWEFCGLPYLGATDIISDDADKGSTPNDGFFLKEVDDFTFNATNQTFSNMWRGHYQAIARANLAIKNIPKINMDETLKSRLIGEAKMLRAFCYLRLVQWFGDLPLVLDQIPEDQYLNTPRTDKNQIYATIEQDLLSAIGTLPEKSAYKPADLGRATKGAAKGILMKLYLLQKKYASVYAIGTEIINSTQYSLMPAYNQIFTRAGENGVESVFEIGAVALQASISGPGSTPYNMVQGVRGVPNLGWGFNRPSDDLIAAYESSDPRRQATIIYVGEVLPDGSTIVQDNPEINNERYNQKAWVGAHPGLQDNGPGNIRLLRYADILLMTAEAACELGDLSNGNLYTNLIRQRARGINNFILKDLALTDQNTLRTAIRRERRVELAMEQQRWFDLVRWGLAEESIKRINKVFTANKHELFPIPQTEIDLSGGTLKQNNGY